MAYALKNTDFTPGDDVVEEEQISVASGDSPVKAQSGNDRVSGTYAGTSSGSGIELAANASLLGESGNDIFEGTSSVSSSGSSTATAYGVRITKSATLDAGVGNDVVWGRAMGMNIANARAISMNTGASLRTGLGNDVVIGEASGLTTAAQTGIEMVDNTLIDTGVGNDVIIGRASADQGTSGTVFGIRGFDSSRISTGWGNDVVIAEASLGGIRRDGFGKNTSKPMTIDLGGDNDYVKGFGNVKLVGGTGFDIYDLSDYRFSDFDAITKSAGQGAAFTIGTGDDAVTASTQGFELFRFQDRILFYQFLPNVV